MEMNGQQMTNGHVHHDPDDLSGGIRASLRYVGGRYFFDTGDFTMADMLRVADVLPSAVPAQRCMPICRCPYVRAATAWGGRAAVRSVSGSLKASPNSSKQTPALRTVLRG